MQANDSATRPTERLVVLYTGKARERLELRDRYRERFALPLEGIEQAARPTMAQHFRIRSSLPLNGRGSPRRDAQREELSL